MTVITGLDRREKWKSIEDKKEEKNEIFLTTDMRGYNYLSFENDRIKIITPNERGCQISLSVKNGDKNLFCTCPSMDEYEDSAA